MKSRHITIAAMMAWLICITCMAGNCEQGATQFLDIVNHVYGSQATQDHPWVQERMDQAIGNATSYSNSTPSQTHEQPSPAYSNSYEGCIHIADANGGYWYCP